MLVQPQGAFTVSNTYATNQYGEVGLAAGTTPLRQPTDAARPGSTDAAAVAADNAARAVTLDDGTSINYLSAANSALIPAYVSLTEPVVVGASVSFTDPVVVDYRNNGWKLNPTTPLAGDGTGTDGVAFANPRTTAPEAVGGDLSIASFNVLNYFTTLGTDDASCVAYTDRLGDGVTVREGCDQRGAWDAADLARQQDKIVAAIEALDADVVGLMEIENSAALGEEADEATATLVDALNAAAGADTWAYVASSADLPAASEQDVITNAIIYQPAAVSPVGAARALGDQSSDGEAFGNAREPIAQVFEPADGGAPFLFVVNHFKSKGSAGPWPGDADAGDGQGASNESRVRQATALRDWVSGIRGDVDAVALVGDFNSYGARRPPAGALRRRLRRRRADLRRVDAVVQLLRTVRVARPRAAQPAPRVSARPEPMCGTSTRVSRWRWSTAASARTGPSSTHRTSTVRATTIPCWSASTPTRRRSP